MINIKNKIISCFYVVSAMVLGSSNALAIDFGKNNVSDSIKWDSNSADVTIQTLITRLLVFIGILAVVYGIYGWFLIMNAWGDDAKVKKGKTIIIQVIIWIVVIFLANSIVQFLLSKILTQP